MSEQICGFCGQRISEGLLRTLTNAGGQGDKRTDPSLDIGANSATSGPVPPAPDPLVGRKPKLTDERGDDLYPPVICNWITDAADRIETLLAEKQADARRIAELESDKRELVWQHNQLMKAAGNEQERAEKAERERDNERVVRRAYEARIEDLERELESARSATEDTARLNWLEGQRQNAGAYVDFDNRGAAIRLDSSLRTPIRDAIDAAISATDNRSD